MLETFVSIAVQVKEAVIKFDGKGTDDKITHEDYRSWAGTKAINIWKSQICNP